MAYSEADIMKIENIIRNQCKIPYYEYSIEDIYSIFSDDEVKGIPNFDIKLMIVLKELVEGTYFRMVEVWDDKQECDVDKYTLDI